MSSIRIAIARMEREITTLKRRVNDLETEVANIKKTRPNRTTETNTGDVELMGHLREGCHKALGGGGARRRSSRRRICERRLAALEKHGAKDPQIHRLLKDNLGEASKLLKVDFMSDTEDGVIRRPGWRSAITNDLFKRLDKLSEREERWSPSALIIEDSVPLADAAKAKLPLWSYKTELKFFTSFSSFLMQPRKHPPQSFHQSKELCPLGLISLHLRLKLFRVISSVLQ
ncbi:hypothetical protein VTP01DRAFT_976 [Rhizomucor pusillus]|uniref:uncharacterized protein n=1 Tax=Rhizomucor pusillus TaxID=4840 RepID=UPI0037434490